MIKAPKEEPRWWHPTQFAKRKPYLDARQKVLTSIRRYFAQDEFSEVETPALQFMPGGEVHVHAFRTLWEDVQTKKTRDLYLHTSPEIAMKKLLTAGVPRLYQLAHVFRNGEHSSLHHPEFLMCEWYRAHVDTKPIMQDCVELVRSSAKAAGRVLFRANHMSCDPFLEWERLSVADAFERYAEIDLLATAPDPREPDRKLLAEAATRIGERVHDSDSWDDLFFRIMGEKIEPYLGKDRPTFLCDYPLSMASLAKPKSDDPRLAERFELYICGIELANAFGELTNSFEQGRRLAADMDQKKKIYGASWPVDEDFLAALTYGMPDSAGCALGVDRLVMLCAGATKIDDVLWAPVSGLDKSA